MKIPVLHIDQFETDQPLSEVYVNSFSNHIQENQDLIYKPHSHNFYLCVIFTAGTGTHEIDFNSYSIQPGKVFFLQPGQTHSWSFQTPPEGYIFFHSQEFYELKFLTHTLNSFPFYYSYQNPPVLQLSTEQLTFLSKLFKELYIEYLHSHLLKELKIVNTLNNIYIALTRNYAVDIHSEKFYSPQYTKTLKRLENLIDKHFRQEKLPQFYAEKLHISTKHLNRVVKSTVNKTTHQLIAERIILEAKRLIVHSNDNLAHVAYALEFSDYAYFSKFFKSKTGVTPLDFRKKYL